MSAVAIAAKPCWTLNHEFERAMNYGEGYPHYGSELEALHVLAKEINEELGRDDVDEEAIAELLGSAAYEEQETCYEIRCNGDCGQAIGWEDNVDAGVGTHFPSGENADQWARDNGWMAPGDGTHWCDYGRCMPTEEAQQKAAEDLARQPGPNDVPLFGGGQ